MINARTIFRAAIVTATLPPIIAIAGPSQGRPASAPTCDAELTWAEEFTSRNYAGFADKVTAETRPGYDSLLAVLHRETSSAATDVACDVIIRRWVAFFRDRHLTIRRVSATQAAPAGGNPDSPTAVRALFASWDRRDLNEAQARARLDAMSDRRNAIEGIWVSTDGNYRVAVLRDAQDGQTFTMTILRADSVYWTPGQVKAVFSPDGAGGYRSRFFMRDHSEQPLAANVERNVLRMSTGSLWLREWPSLADELKPIERRMMTDGRFAAYDVAPGTVLMRVPTFNDPKGIDSLFATEGARIRGAERLIIDVRGNGGGSDYNYREIIPLLYTNPIHLAGADALATEDNIASQLEMAADTTYPKEQRDQLTLMARRMESNRGGWWRGNDGTQKMPRVLDKPRSVAVIVDQGCGSSCEQFLLAARQSTKVTLYGDRSAGVLDYGNVRSTTMPGGTLIVARPITRSRRLPKEAIDNIGIVPDVRIPAGVVLTVPWVLTRMRN